MLAVSPNFYVVFLFLFCSKIFLISLLIFLRPNGFFWGGFSKDISSFYFKFNSIVPENILFKFESFSIYFPEIVYFGE